MAQDGSLRAPQTMKLGNMNYEDTVRLAWGICSIFKKISLEKVKFMVSRAPKPRNVRHRILVGGIEKYSVHVNMNTKTIAFDGPFVFRTPTKASQTLSDYAFPIATGRVWNPRKPKEPSSSSEEKQSLSDWKVGSFLEIRDNKDTKPNWIGVVMDNADALLLGIYPMEETSKGSNLYRQDKRSWLVQRDAVIKEIDALKQIEKGVWMKTTVLQDQTNQPLLPPSEEMAILEREPPLSLKGNETVSEWKVGSFVEIRQSPTAPRVTGMVAGNSTDPSKLEIYHMRKQGSGSNVYKKREPPYAVPRKYIVKEIEPLKEFGKGGWYKPFVRQNQTNQAALVTIPPKETEKLASSPKPLSVEDIHALPAEPLHSTPLLDWRVGSFLEIIDEPTRVHWIGMVVNNTDSSTVEVCHFNQRAANEHLHEKSPRTWHVPRNHVIKEVESWKEIENGLWLKPAVTPKATSIPAAKIASIVPPAEVPRPVPELEENPRKRVESEVRSMQEHTKRLRMSLDTLEKATFDLAFQWNVPLVQ
jgi:hypothetical protein